MSNMRKFAIVAAIAPLVVIFVWWRISSHQAQQPSTRAAAIQSSDPFTKVIAEVEVPPGGKDEPVWSNKIALPDPNGPETRFRPEGVPVEIQVLDETGTVVPEMSIKDSRDTKVSLQGLPENWSIQASSLIPNRGGKLKLMGK